MNERIISVVIGEIVYDWDTNSLVKYEDKKYMGCIIKYIERVIVQDNIMTVYILGTVCCIK